MSSKHKDIKLESPLAPVMHKFIKEKRACGYKYEAAVRELKRFDCYLCSVRLKKIELSKEMVLNWVAKRDHENASTQQHRVGLIRQLALFMARMDHMAYVVPWGVGPTQTNSFSPYIFTRKDISKLIHAADQIKPGVRSPMRHIIIPEIFRLLYGCGFRVSEVLNLRVEDVDLEKGVIIVRDTKFGKDRLVPPALDMVTRLQIYAARLREESLEKQTDKSFFFPSTPQTGWSKSGIYILFRKLLYQCGIHHGGRGRGPRVHDLRHTFAVHRLIQWYEEGADLNTKLPLLVSYLGHQDFTGTQKYLHLTAELFPNLTARMNKQFGTVIPKGWR